MTKSDFLKKALLDEDILLDDGEYKFVVRKVNKSQIKMSEHFENQLKSENIYNKVWICAIIPAEENSKKLPMEYLPIYGDSSKWITKWFRRSKEEAINDFLNDNNIALLKRVTK